jgi:hypothetical protein
METWRMAGCAASSLKGNLRAGARGQVRFTREQWPRSVLTVTESQEPRKQ